MISLFKKNKQSVIKEVINTKLIDALNWLSSVQGQIEFSHGILNKNMVRIWIWQGWHEHLYESISIKEQFGESEEPCVVLYETIEKARKEFGKSDGQRRAPTEPEAPLPKWVLADATVARARGRQ